MVSTRRRKSSERRVTLSTKKKRGKANSAVDDNKDGNEIDNDAIDVHDDSEVGSSKETKQFSDNEERMNHKKQPVEDNDDSSKNSESDEDSIHEEVKSSSKNKNERTSGQKQLADNNDDNSDNGEDEENKHEQVKSSSKSKKKKKGSSHKKQLAEELRSKSTGLGLSISIEKKATPVNKKIVFDSDEEVDNNDVEEEVANDDVEETGQNKIVEENDENGDSDDDSDVEEVTKDVAKSQAEEEMERQRATSRAALALSKKPTRKRKKKDEKVENENDDDDEFDDEFFEQLDAERAAERKKRKAEQKQKLLEGRHTSFRIRVDGNDEDEDDTGALPTKQINQNMEVVVLGVAEEDEETDVNEKALAFFHGSGEPSDMAKKLAQRQIIDGTFPRSDSNRHSAVARHGARKAEKNVVAWKRSKKMTRIVTAGNRAAQQRSGKGQAAFNFVVKME